MIGPDKEAEFGLYVDPGTRFAGYVLFGAGNRLVHTGLVRRPSDAPSGPVESRKWSIRIGLEIVEQTLMVVPFAAKLRVVVEYQQIYTHGKQRTKNPKDVLVLTLQSGGILCALMADKNISVTSWDLREPAVWKKNVKEALLKDRTRSQLDEREIACFDRLGRAKNNADVWVAAGIGLHDVGRRLA